MIPEAYALIGLYAFMFLILGLQMPGGAFDKLAVVLSERRIARRRRKRLKGQDDSSG